MTKFKKGDRIRTKTYIGTVVSMTQQRAWWVRRRGFTRDDIAMFLMERVVAQWDDDPIGKFHWAHVEDCELVFTPPSSKKGTKWRAVTPHMAIDTTATALVIKSSSRVLSERPGLIVTDQATYMEIA